MGSAPVIPRFPPNSYRSMSTSWKTRRMISQPVQIHVHRLDLDFQIRTEVFFSVSTLQGTVQPAGTVEIRKLRIPPYKYACQYGRNPGNREYHRINKPAGTVGIQHMGIAPVIPRVSVRQKSMKPRKLPYKHLLVRWKSGEVLSVPYQKIASQGHGKDRMFRLPFPGVQNTLQMRRAERKMRTLLWTCHFVCDKIRIWEFRTENIRLKSAGLPAS